MNEQYLPGNPQTQQYQTFPIQHTHQQNMPHYPTPLLSPTTFQPDTSDETLAAYAAAAALASVSHSSFHNNTNYTSAEHNQQYFPLRKQHYNYLQQRSLVSMDSSDEDGLPEALLRTHATYLGAISQFQPERNDVHTSPQTTIAPNGHFLTSTPFRKIYDDTSYLTEAENSNNYTRPISTGHTANTTEQLSQGSSVFNTSYEGADEDDLDSKYPVEDFSEEDCDIMQYRLLSLQRMMEIYAAKKQESDAAQVPITHFLPTLSKAPNPSVYPGFQSTEPLFSNARRQSTTPVVYTTSSQSSSSEDEPVAVRGRQLKQLHQHQQQEPRSSSSSSSAPLASKSRPPLKELKINIWRSPSTSSNKPQKSSSVDKQVHRRRARLPRSKTGCWTCRCRRKKCDEMKPGCRACELLGLSCAGYGHERPPFMWDKAASARYRAEISEAIRIQKAKQKK